jgi:hypothetical protein
MMGPHGGNIDDVSPTVTSLRREGTRGRERARPATHPPHRVRPGSGRAWINGREVGGANPRFAHLAGSYD